MFLAEDLEVSGNYEECIKNFTEAAQIFHELGKLSKEKEVQKDRTRQHKTQQSHKKYQQPTKK